MAVQYLWQSACKHLKHIIVLRAAIFNSILFDCASLSVVFMFSSTHASLSVFVFISVQHIVAGVSTDTQHIQLIAKYCAKVFWGFFYTLCLLWADKNSNRLSATDVKSKERKRLVFFLTFSLVSVFVLLFSNFFYFSFYYYLQQIVRLGIVE